MKKCVCGEEMTPAEWKNQWVCHRCGRTKPMRTTVTNADRIRSMSDEELSVLIAKEIVHVPLSGFYVAKSAWLRWLQETVEKEGADNG